MGRVVVTGPNIVTIMWITHKISALRNVRDLPFSSAKIPLNIDKIDCQEEFYGVKTS